MIQELIYALVGTSLMAIIFLWLFIRSVITNGKLKSNIAELSKNVNIKQKQLEIAANIPSTPVDLAKRMHDGSL